MYRELIVTLKKTATNSSLSEDDTQNDIHVKEEAIHLSVGFTDVHTYVYRCMNIF